jgi:hypothetical protein
VSVRVLTSFVRLACAAYLRHRSTGIFGTSGQDSVFVENKLIGAPIPISLNDLDDVTSILIGECNRSEWEWLRLLPELLRATGLDLSYSACVEVLPTAKLDHSLYVRASPRYRGEDRHDFVESLLEDEHGVEYSRYDHLVALVRVHDSVSGDTHEVGIVEPYEEVKELVLPHRALDKVKKRVLEARARLNSQIYDRSDGASRLGRPYVVCDPYFKKFAVRPVAGMLSASHFIHDFATEYCFYVADTQFYYR